MRVYEKQLLDKRLKDFMEEVLPLDLLPYLSCLQKTDKEAVEAVQNNTGATRAVCMLVDRLKRRDKGFTQFVLALRKCGSAHTALLLDPYEHVEDTEDEAADTEDESELGFKKIGTVIDVKISGNILPKHGEEQSDNCREVEKYVAETYETPLSENSKRMRKELQQHLPIGAVFVHTEKGSIISTFRLSSASAANEFWAMYKEGKLQSMLQTVLVDSTLQENEKSPEEQLELKVNLGEERFKTIQKTLADIESDQEIKESGSWLSSPIRKEGETADEDESELEIEIDIPPVYLENGKPLGSPELILRDYQQELAHPALQGKNTIICAPTNSGKTYVAIEIAKNHLESFSKNQDTCGPPDTRKELEPRVVFIVSTVNLVLQQKERFELFLGDKYSVSEISGANATEIPLKYLLQSHKVVIMTAQILVNALNAPDREQRVQLNDMSLLIFDECHHAHKEHSYNRVMEKYLALKMQPGKEHRLPQIVGLTASLGTGKAKTAQKAEEHIILVCANLDAEVVSTVRNHQSELEKFVNVPKRAVFQVAKNDQDPFERIINQVMDKIHEGTKGFLGKSYKVPPPEKGGQQYRQWVEELYKDSVADGHRYLVTYAEHLRVYHIALTINKNTRMKNAKLHLQKYFDSLDEDRFTEIDRKLKSMFFRAMQVLSKFVQEHGEPQNPRLLRLKELLLDHHKNGATQEEKKQKEDDAENTSKAEDLGQTEVETAPVDENQTENKELKAGEEFQEPGVTSEEGEGEDSASEKNVAAQEEKERKEDPPDDKKNISKAEDLGQTDVETASVAGNQPKNKEIKAGEEFQEPGETSEEGEDMKRNGGSGSEEDPFQNNQESAEESEEVNRSDVQSAGEEASTTEEEDREETSASSTDESQETKHIANEKPGPKGILFTRTRDSTEALLDWIKETDELNIVLRPEALVGSGDGTIGMTQHEQEQVIKRFKTGEKNLLLATSVAEEGLDISDCNYVIRYDMMGNEISSVQSRGRVRADEGKYSVVVSTESGAGKRELTNRFRECLMIEALSKVQSMDPKTFIIKVRTIQRTTSQDRFLKKQVVACRKSANLPDDVKFRCRKCSNIACQAGDIRRIKDNYHVVINRNFRDSEVVLEPLSKPKKIDDILMAKKIYCHKCKEDFGVTALINSVEWMCIKVRSFVLEFSDKNPSRRMYRKWKDVPFSIREASVDELLKQATDQGGAEFDSDDFNLD